MKYIFINAIITITLFSSLLSASNSEDIEAGFKNPPATAKPHTWWHWVDGNISKQGITADLEAMAEVGIGGAQIFNVGGKTVNVPQGPVKFMSPEWLDMVKHAATEADRLGIELCLHNCAGWSSTGGPWITPEYSMQVVVYNEIKTTGPSQFQQVLPQPMTNMNYYRDIAVLAFPTPANDQFRINEATLKSAGLIYVDYQNSKKYSLYPDFSPVPFDAAIALDSIIDLTPHTDHDGFLNWSVPDGSWTILRMGYTTTGRTNHPACEGGLGLECDKLSKKALDLHWEKGIKPILDKLGPLAGKVLNNLLIDSYEVGANNWTPEKCSEFKKRTGYDLLYYLPTLAGRVVENAQITERFLWDFRHVNSQMFAENYFGYFAKKCRQHGLLSSIEPYNGPFECLAIGADYDIQMGEFWVPNNSISQEDPSKLAATSAHTHGQKIVGAEAFTSMPEYGRWQNHPASLKILGDQAYCIGINRFIFHRFAHQPWMKYLPGMTMGQWGTHFDRTNTWFRQSKSWMQYITRSQYMLQQGRFVADVLFFAGQSIPSGIVTSQKLKDVGYDYDVIGTDLIEKLSVKNGLLTLPCGMQYKLLVMPETVFMTTKLAEKIRKLVQAGAVLIAPKPKYSPSLMDYKRYGDKLNDIADQLWTADNDIKTLNKAHGKGRILSDILPEDALTLLKIEPDFIDLSDEPQTSFIHRKTKDTDIYFISSRNIDQNTIRCSFRISGKAPQLWNPETAVIEPAALWQSENDRTVVTINLPPCGSMFVIFNDSADIPADPYTTISSQITKDNSIQASTDKFTPAPIVPNLSITKDQTILSVADNGTYSLAKTSGQKTTVDVTDIPVPVTITGSWNVNFSPDWNAPDSITFPELISWTDHEIQGIRYYSGTATYNKDFDVPADFISADRKIILDLGQVLCLADVKLNDQYLGTVWKMPFQIDITNSIKPGKNKLQVAVTNLWVNRLIGDEQYPDDCQWQDSALTQWPQWFINDQPHPVRERLTFTTWKHWKKDDPLLPSGLLGPVVLRPVKNVTINN